MHEEHFWNLLAKKLACEASEKEIQELELLVKSYPELSYAAQHVTDIWNQQKTESSKEAEKAFQNHLQRLQKQGSFIDSPAIQIPENNLAKPNKTKIKFPIVIAALITITAAVLIWMPAQKKPVEPPPQQTEEVYTRPGTRTRLVLPDSSVVYLNAGSRLTYSHPFGVNVRSVTLIGEAFFDVVKDQKPFIIHTNGIHIKVLGTAFNVRSYPDEKKTETSLVRGSVEVSVEKSPEKKYILKPNEKLLLRTGENLSTFSPKKTTAPLAILSTVNYIDSSTIAETSWVENKLVFADESFADIATKMERWYGVNIHFRNENIKQERFTGVFEKESVWQALEAMQMTADFQYFLKNNEITIYTK